MVENIKNLDPDAIGLCIQRNTKNKHYVCEIVFFSKVRYIKDVLTKASMAGEVKIEPFEDSMDYFADVYVSKDTWSQSIALDRHSYYVLKNVLLKCKLDMPE